MNSNPKPSNGPEIPKNWSAYDFDPNLTKQVKVEGPPRDESISGKTIERQTLQFIPQYFETASRDALTRPPTGLIIYNTTTNTVNVYNGSTWQVIGGAAGGSDTEVQFNSGGVLTGDPNFAWDSNILYLENSGVMSNSGDIFLGSLAGQVDLFAGDGGTNQNGEIIVIGAGSGNGTGSGGAVFITAGSAGLSGTNGGSVWLTPGGAVGGQAGDIIHSAPSSSSMRRFHYANINTTNATPTNLTAYSITNEKVLYFRAVVTAYRTGGVSGTAGDAAVYMFSAAYKDISGTATLFGSIATELTQEDQAGWDATFTTSGTDVIVQVTGAAGNNIAWALSLEIYGANF